MTIKLSSLFTGGVDSGVTGTGKRVYYGMLSRNTSSTWHGAALFDRNFVGSIFNNGYPAAYNSYSPSHIIDNSSSTHSNYNSIWNNVYGGTQTTPSSSTTPNWVNSTNASGEFGNAMVDLYSDGTLSNIMSRYSGTTYVKHYLNAAAINSDHSNRRIVYLLISGVVRAVDRLFGSYHVCMSGTADYSVSSLNGSMYGSASYNQARKELTILSYSSSGGAFNVITFQNVDFDKYPDPYVALNRAEVVRVNSTVSLSSNWAVNNAESYYNLKPVVTDNGKVYVSVFFTSNNFTLYEFTRSGTSAITATYVTQLGTTTSYGFDQGSPYYGQRTIISRDGTTVATFCPYYYYGSGIRCFMIDKTNNTYATYSNNSSSAGIQTLPHSDSGWKFAFCSNGYAGNWTGNYILATYGRSPTGGFQQTGTTQYFPYHTGPNTTNYPGFTQVVDYVLLPNNNYGPK